MNIPAGEFKAKCLQLMDKVNKTNEEIIITKYGKPIAKLVAIEAKKKKDIYGCMKGTGRIVGDIISPLDVEWSADEDNI